MDQSLCMYNPVIEPHRNYRVTDDRGPGLASGLTWMFDLGHSFHCLPSSTHTHRNLAEL